MIQAFLYYTGVFSPILALGIVYYFFVYRPQQQEQEHVAAIIEQLKIGTKILTRGGIVGTVCLLKPETMVIQVYDGTRLEILKEAVIDFMHDH